MPLLPGKVLNRSWSFISPSVTAKEGYDSDYLVEIMPVLGSFIENRVVLIKYSANNILSDKKYFLKRGGAKAAPAVG